MSTNNASQTLKSSKAGDGKVVIGVNDAGRPRYETLQFTYPLKLVPSTPHNLSEDEEQREVSSSLPQTGHSTTAKARSLTHVPLLFFLSYGGGILPPDSLSLDLTLEPGTRLTIATQGSTKIFPCPDLEDASAASNLPIATQSLYTALKRDSALALLPDPIQPFRNSRYIQTQIFNVHPSSSLILLDWVTQGRAARGENWDFISWRNKNEIWLATPDSPSRLLLRDLVILSGGPHGISQSSLRNEQTGVFGTLMIRGSLLTRLEAFFLSEFAALPRIGARDWGDEPVSSFEKGSFAERLDVFRKRRLHQEVRNGVLWTAARTRRIVIVKFVSRELEGAKIWLESMLRFEGTIAKEFGEGAFMWAR